MFQGSLSSITTTQKAFLGSLKSFCIASVFRIGYPYLFVFEDFPDLNIPNTTNLLEEKFKDMKRSLSNHQGMHKDNKILFIKDFYLQNRTNSTHFGLYGVFQQK